ncbi:MAG TPA: response regulator transcription factor [Rubrivivax sp.]|jgi:CheY-like chemotaxis protein|nr:response regulator transcription factor [Rubrivivax sp.]
MERKPRWLVVDDSPHFADRAREALADAGADIVGVAGDGVQALELFEDLCPDGLVLDFSMPRLDGIAVARSVRRIERQPGHSGRCLIAMLTLHADAGLREAAIASGVDAFLDKAREFETLVGMVAPVPQADDTRRTPRTPPPRSPG